MGRLTLAALQNLVVYFVFYLLISTIAPYSSYVLKTSTGISGLASGMFVIGILFGRLATGAISAKASPKKVLVPGNLAFAFLSSLYPMVRDPFSLIALRFLHGASFGVVHNACGTIAAGVLPPSRRGEGIAYYSFGQIISAALGPFLGLRFVASSDFRNVFLVAIGASFLSFGLSFTIPDLEKGSGDGRSRPHSLRLIEPSAVPVSVVIMVSGLAFSGIMAFLSMYGAEVHLSEATSQFFLVYAASVLMTRPLSGRMLDRWGARLVLPLCLSLFAMGLFALAFAKSGPAVLLSALFIGLGYGNVLSLGQAEAVRRVPKELIALATATYFVFLDIGAGLGPYLFGSLLPFLGYRSLYLLMGLMVLVLIPAYGGLLGLLGPKARGPLETAQGPFKR